MSKIRKILFVFTGVLFISIFLTTIAWSCVSSDLRIEKSGPDCAVPGDEIVYTICVWNAGSGVVDDVMISDTIPAGTTFVSASGDYTGPDPDCVVWNLGSIAADKVCVTLTVRVDPDFDISTESEIPQNNNPQPVISNNACGFTGSCSETNCSASVITYVKASCDGVFECGNGLLEGTEECDDGNTVDGDGCSSDCKLEYCGDGEMDQGEECDDGNMVDGDGCSSDCKLEYCGDGEMDQGEECDDGNTVDGDGCSSDCKLEYCGDGIIQPGLNEECDDGNNVDGDGCSANCELEFECGECKGKVTELTLSYLGAVAADIAVYEGKDPKPENNVFSALVLPGELFTFNGTGVGKDITLGTEISIFVDGVLNTKIHTSCSQPIGPGLISGDFEVIAGSSKDGGLLCPVSPPPSDGCGECKGKVTELTLSYLGAVAADIAVYEGKDPKPEKNVFSAYVLPGEIFSFNGTGVGKDSTLETEISIFVDGVLNTKIHTSCSQPIGPGLISGDFEVIEGRSKDGGLLCPVSPPPSDGCGECKGKVTELTLSYLGAVGANIEVYEGKDPKPEKNVFSAFVLPGEIFSFNGTGVGKDITLETEISIFVDGVLNTKIHTSCSQPIGPGLISGDFEVIAGSSKDGGLLCPVSPPSSDDCECKGKVTELTLSYLGAVGADITVYEGKDPKLEKNVFSAYVLPGESFSFNGTGVGKDITLETEISIYVDGELNTKIHTSCSQPIGPGLISGDFEVIEGSSKDGGLLCPL